MFGAVPGLQAQLQRLRQPASSSASVSVGAASASLLASPQQLQPVAENGSANNGPEKRFRSNRGKLQQQQDERASVNGNAINVTRSSSKLKPVSERRPTALPSEVPSIEVEEVLDTAKEAAANAQVANDDDVVDGGGGKSKLKVNVNGIIDGGGDDGDGVSTTTPGTETETGGPVKFFIGHTQELGTTHQTDDTLSWQSGDANNNCSSGEAKLTNGFLPQERREQDSNSNGNRNRSLQPLRAQSSSNVSLNYPSAKSPAADSQRRRRVSTMPDINIPPAPPMPPELLVPGTPLHLRKKRSVERPTPEEQAANAPNNQVSNERRCVLPNDRTGNWPELCGVRAICLAISQ